MQYGYSFFKIAAKASIEHQKQQVISMAIAVKLAFADAEAWKKFTK
jgi:hypothetical protein